MSRFIPVQEAISMLCLSENDILQRNKGRYLKWAKLVWRDMNMSSVKIAIRRKIQINKRTNSIDMPCNFLQLSGISVEDCFGNKYPVFRNDRVNDDIVDISAAKDCACDCGGEICNLIKGYEAIVEQKTELMPDNSTKTFTCVNRKAVDSNGFLYEEKQYPEIIYEDSVWVDVQLKTETKQLCKLETNEKGCVCDTKENLDNICNSCVSHGGDNIPYIPIGGNANEYTPDVAQDKWIYACNTKMEWFSVECGNFFSRKCGFNNVYNVSEEGDRIIFPRNFGFDHVIVRSYEDVNLSDLTIPFNALKAFWTGTKWYNCMNDDSKQGLAKGYEVRFGQQCFSLLKDMNKYRIDELRMIFTPPVHIPSYIPPRNYYMPFGTDYGFSNDWY